MVSFSRSCRRCDHQARYRVGQHPPGMRIGFEGHDDCPSEAGAAPSGGHAAAMRGRRLPMAVSSRREEAARGKHSLGQRLRLPRDELAGARDFRAMPTGMVIIVLGHRHEQQGGEASRS